MRLCARIEFDAEADEFRTAYLTGAAEWSLDAKCAFRGSLEECKALAILQPLQCIIAFCEPSPSQVFEQTARRLGEHE